MPIKFQDHKKYLLINYGTTGIFNGQAIKFHNVAGKRWKAARPLSVNCAPQNGPFEVWKDHNFWGQPVPTSSWLTATDSRSISPWADAPQSPRRPSLRRNVFELWDPTPSAANLLWTSCCACNYRLQIRPRRDADAYWLDCLAPYFLLALFGGGHRKSIITVHSTSRMDKQTNGILIGADICVCEYPASVEIRNNPMQMSAADA